MSRFPTMDQNPREFAEFLDEIERAGCKSILEVGVFQGGTLARFTSRFPGAVVVGIDSRPLLNVYGNDYAQLSRQIVQGSSHDPYVRQRAYSILRSLNGGEQFDAIFIDGDHTYTGVWEDWRWAISSAKKLVGFHDIASEGNPDIQVREPWQVFSLAAQNNGLRTREICYDDGRNGIGVIWVS